ncbi:MAG: laccase domain-containing protein [Proteobacteria bacterium]|nr:laccase domain-containing protein [Pseudomonadota bacterium]
MLKVIRDPSFEKITGIQHAFFTRQGGVSTGVHSSLNCCYRGKDDPANVRKNRQRVMSYLGIPFDSLATTVNIHGSKVIVVKDPWSEDALPEADGMVTNQKNIVLASDSADCPIVLYADNYSGVIGLAHAGWKSTFAGNILTDRELLYFSDFGLALSSQFELTQAESDFLKTHHNYDQSCAAVNLLHCIITTIFGKEQWEVELQKYAGNQQNILSPPIDSIIKKYAPIALIMDEFFQQLQKNSKLTSYPVDSLEKLLQLTPNGEKR